MNALPSKLNIDSGLIKRIYRTRFSVLLVHILDEVLVLVDVVVYVKEFAGDDHADCSRREVVEGAP